MIFGPRLTFVSYLHFPWCRVLNMYAQTFGPLFALHAVEYSKYSIIQIFPIFLEVGGGRNALDFYFFYVDHAFISFYGP